MQEQTKRQKTFQEQLEIMRQSYAARLPAKIDQISEIWKALLQNPADAETGRALYRMAHSLAGSGRTFGLPAVTDAARTLENLIESATQVHVAPPEAQTAQFETLLDVLREAATQTDTSLLSQPAQRFVPSELQNEFLTPPEPFAFDGAAWPMENNRLTLLLGPGQQEAEVEEGSGHDEKPLQLVAQLEFFGYQVQICRDVQELQRVVEQTLPAALLVQVGAQHLDMASVALEPVQAERDVPLPVICITDHDDLETRLRAVRAGSCEFFTMPVDVSSVIGKLQTLTSRQTPLAFRALIVEDDPALANLYAFILQQAGMHTTVALEPCRIMQLLHEQTPDVILMDILMPDCNGLEVARAIRQLDAFAGVPIIFLSIDSAQKRQMIEMNLGGDMFLSKPVHPEHLVAATIASAQRSRALRSFMVRDSLTGLYNHTSIKEQLDVELSRTLRSGQPLSVALLDLDNFQKINEDHGHAYGDRVLRSVARLLRQLMRKTDIIGRYSDDLFVAILPEADGENAEKVLDRVRRHFEQVCHRTQQAEFCMTFSCGISTLAAASPENNDDGLADQLIRTAERALKQAKTQGRNCIVQIDDGSSENLP